MRINFILVICGFVFFSGCALNQDVKNLERRMLQLEIKMQQIKDNIASQQAKDNSLKDQYAGQSAEFNQLKEDIAKLNGRIDETEHNFDQALKKNATAIAQLPQTTSGNESGIRGQEGGVIGLDGPPVPNQANTQAPIAGIPDNNAANLSEKEIYNVAKQAYDREDYDADRQGFESFLKNFPKSDEADNARFWIGESYFKQGWFQKAILEYQEVIEKYPNDNKAPSAYLKQGLAFDKLGEKANALLVFQELIKRFPNSGEAKTARQKISQLE